jgi:D-glycero-D-manno-heptose 1,7-bisphosphate phosphatase
VSAPPGSSRLRPGVFLDRDGTINVRPREHDYIRNSRDFEWLPGALEGMLKLTRAGLPLVVVSNQRGISRGLVSYATLHEIEARIQEALAPHGEKVVAFRYCPHGLDEGCDCRKPRPGLLRSAADDLQLDLQRSWMIGDSDADVEAGEAAGCQTIRLGADPHIHERTAASLLEAAEIVIAAQADG